MIGRTLDRYRIESKLGEGGMGVVYKARDTHLDRLVAIKVLPRDKLVDPARKQRFVQEARTASALNHPGIVTVHDIRSDAGVDFIVMELVEGETLDRVIPAQGLGVGQVLRLAVDIGDAVASAHAAGVIHRDLKPSNIMVTLAGRAKVLDFGLAKLLQLEEPSPEAPTLVGPPLSEAGVLLGTAAYMSPEQAEGRRLDGRSDVFSFGSVLYEMITGRRPFAGDSALSILTRVVSEEPTPPGQLAASVPPELEAIVLRCLRKDPARRFQTMADLKAALQDVEESRRSRSPAQQTNRPRRWRWAAPLAGLLAVALLAERLLRRPDAAAPLRVLPLTALPGQELYPALSPDGNHVAFTWYGARRDNADIYVQLIGSAGEPLRLTSDPRNDYNPVWSPDGLSIAFLRLQPEGSRSDLRLVPPLGGPERKLAEIRVGEAFVTAPYLAWLPDGSGLVVTDAPGDGQPLALVHVLLATGEKRPLTRPGPKAAGDAHPAVSPDGRSLVFRRNASALFAGELYQLALGPDWTVAQEPRRLTPVALDAEHPAFMPDSKEIVFSARGGLWRLEVDGGGPGMRAPTRLPFVGEDGRMPQVARAQAGRPSRLVYVRSFFDFNIHRLETAGAGAASSSPGAVSISSTREDGMPQLSPDGSRVAFSSDRSGGWEIWLADLDGSSAIQLTWLGARVTGYPHWSPDGARIAFHSMVEGQPEVFVVQAAGGAPRQLTAHPSSGSFPSFSRDGAWIYFTSKRAGEDRIWKMPAEGGDALPVTDRVGYAPAESLDGAYLYYVENIFTPSALWRQPVSGGAPAKVLEGVVLGNFAAVEGGIYYVDRPAGEQGLYSVDPESSQTRLRYFDFATGRAHTVAPDLGSVDLPLAVGRGGRTILYGRMDASVVDLMLVEGFR